MAPTRATTYPDVQKPTRASRESCRSSIGFLRTSHYESKKAAIATAVQNTWPSPRWYQAKKLRVFRCLDTSRLSGRLRKPDHRSPRRPLRQELYRLSPETVVVLVLHPADVHDRKCPLQ